MFRVTLQQILVIYNGGRNPLWYIRSELTVHCCHVQTGIFCFRSSAPKLNRGPGEMSESEKIIHDFFTDGESVGKLVRFLSLEEVKGRDTFDVKRFSLFKGLFR